jgi:hypothetical protein
MVAYLNIRIGLNLEYLYKSTAYKNSVKRTDNKIATAAIAIGMIVMVVFLWN